MHAVRAIHVSHAAGPITTHRRSKVALGVLGVVLTAAMAPGVASASHARPHADVYLGQLERHFAIEYPSASTSEASSSTFLDGLQRHFAIEYPSYVWDGRLAGSPTPVYRWDGRLAG